MTRSKTALISQYYDEKPAYRKHTRTGYVLFGVSIVLAGIGIAMAVLTNNAVVCGFASAKLAGVCLFAVAFVICVVGVGLIMKTVMDEHHARTFIQERMGSRFADVEEKCAAEMSDSHFEEYPRVLLAGFSQEAVLGNKPRYWVDDSEAIHSTNMKAACLVFSQDALCCFVRMAAIDTKDDHEDSFVRIAYDALVSASVVEVEFPLNRAIRKMSAGAYRTLRLQTLDDSYDIPLVFRDPITPERDRYFNNELVLVAKELKARCAGCLLGGF